ncbi:MAG: mechanosensitive ion channel [Paludibacter sp.]|nr:mechanosensitive ion channel [Paludibacter sp.]
MKRTIIICYLTIFCLGVFAQAKSNQASVVTKARLTQNLPADSLKTKAKVVKRMHKKMIMSLDTLTLSDYTLSIERVNDNLNTIGDSAKLGFDVENIARRIDYMTNYVKLIRQNFKGRHSVIHLKNQYLYQSFTSKLDDETDRIQAQLDNLYHRVYHAKLHLKKVLSDSIFRKLYADKDLRATFDDKLIRLEWKWNRTDSVTKANLDTLNNLKVRLSDNSLILSNILNILDKRLDNAVPKLFGQEVNYLWQVDGDQTKSPKSAKNMISIFKGEQNAISFYLSQTSKERTNVVLIGILLFIWLFFKRKLLKTVRIQNDTYNYLNLKYLNNFPILSLLILLLSLMPFFDAYAPTSYISIEFILLLIASTVIFFKNSDRKFLFNWLALVVLLIIDVTVYLLIEPTFVERLLQLGIHLCIMFFVISFYRTLQKKMPYYRFIKLATILGIILSGLSIIYNLFGRFSLSGVVGIASVFAVTQAIVLTVFVEVIFEIILLQLQSSRLKKGIDKPFETSIVINKIKTPLIIVAVLIWFITLTSNLNIYHGISDATVDSLTRIRTIGSISFQLLSVIMFFVIIWIAHILQRLLSFLFGETGDVEDLTTKSKGQHSRLLITRLLVLIGGYLLAIAASGLPIDKLTFLLGALGVGIGMGLQSIVNNFVSGIILIFDGSLQIGDEIEVSGQAGKVKEIGLRASTLYTADGAEVIIPNGNILSQNIINWTFTNDEKRIMLSFSLTGNELDANLINEIINDTIKNIPHAISQRKPVILYTKVTPVSCSLTIRFWSTISKFEVVKSEAMQQLSAAFTAKNIGFE